MPQPPPDPEKVVRAFELAAQHVPYRQIKDELEVSIGTVSAWVKLGATWWNEAERLSQLQEWGWHRAALRQLFEWVEKEVDLGNLSRVDSIPLHIKLLERHAKLTGVDAEIRLSIASGSRPEPPPAAMRAIENLRRRAIEQEKRDEPDF